MALIETLNDDYNDNSTDGAKWTTFTASSGTVSETGGRVLITPANSTAGSTAGYRSFANFDLTGSVALVQVKQAADTTNCFTEFILQIDSSNNFAMSVSGGNLQVYKTVAGAFTSLATTAYVPATHQWWRIRENGGQTYWDYSADGVTWVNFFHVANPITVTSLQVQLDAYENISTGTPGTASFDNFNLGTVGYPISDITDNFNGNSLNTAKWTAYTASSGTVTNVNYELREALAATTSGSWAGIYSNKQYNLTGQSVSVRVVSATTGNSWLDLTLAMEQLPVVDNFFSIGVDVGRQKLQAIKEIAGTDTTLNEINYDPAIHKYIQLKELGGTIYFNWSTSGKSDDWNELWNTAILPGIPVTNLYIVLDDFEYDALSTPSAHTLDDFNILPRNVLTRNITRPRPFAPGIAR